MKGGGDPKAVETPGFCISAGPLKAFGLEVGTGVGGLARGQGPCKDRANFVPFSCLCFRKIIRTAQGTGFLGSQSGQIGQLFLISGRNVLSREGQD